MCGNLELVRQSGRSAAIQITYLGSFVCQFPADDASGVTTCTGKRGGRSAQKVRLFSDLSDQISVGKMSSFDCAQQNSLRNRCPEVSAQPTYLAGEMVRDDKRHNHLYLSPGSKSDCIFCGGPGVCCRGRDGANLPHTSNCRRCWRHCYLHRIAGNSLCILAHGMLVFLTDRERALQQAILRLESR